MLVTRLLCACLLALAMQVPAATAQALPGTKPSPSPTQPEAPKDALGRSTPRGTVLGFLAAARKGDNELSRFYLDTSLSESAAADLAHQLFVVLDARLPPRLTQLSEAPEGSHPNPLAPDRELVGTIRGPHGNVDVVVERVKRAGDQIWLFSRDTLAAIPAVYEDVLSGSRPWFIPRFLADRGVAGVRMFEWLAVLIGLPLFYAATVLVNRAGTHFAARLWPRLLRGEHPPAQNILPAPARLFLLALASRWLFSILPLSLLVRQSLSNLAFLLEVAAGVWILLRLSGVVEEQVLERVARASSPAAISLVRAGRHICNVSVLLVAVLVTLRHFGVNLTPVLAGLGVGGIAVALAAQKTLENIIAGASLIFDKAVQVGDVLKIGELQGTVEHIGLRSTRIRTLDRTVVTIPNGQLAMVTVETLSARDKFWFHHVVGLVYETSPEQLESVLAGTRDMLAAHVAVEPESTRVRFLRLGAFSLDVDVFAYVLARDWPHFLEIQEQLLVKLAEVVSRTGTSIAFPSQTMYVERTGEPVP